MIFVVGTQKLSQGCVVGKKWNLGILTTSHFEPYDYLNSISYTVAVVALLVELIRFPLHITKTSRTWSQVGACTSFVVLPCQPLFS